MQAVGKTLVILELLKTTGKTLGKTKGQQKGGVYLFLGRTVPLQSVHK
jgi:hypothetical protein